MLLAAPLVDQAAARARGRHRRRWRPLLLVFALLSVYPLSVLSYVYGYTLSSGLPGGRHGPQDAYRHVLASAVVAWSLSPRAVALATRAMESDPEPGSRMDRHNNAIGASIGASARTFAEIRPRVLARVQAGRVDAIDAEQVTWLPPREWRDLPF